MTAIKRIPKEKVAVLHVCSQREQIAQLIKNTDKLSIIITGNGNPKDGYVYKVMEMGDEVKAISEKLTGISGIVKELHEESVGKKAIKKTDKERLISILKIIGVIVAFITLVFVAFNSYTGKEKSSEALDQTKDINIRMSHPRGIIVPENVKPFKLDTARIDSIIKARERDLK